MPVPMLMVVNDYKKLVEAGADLEIQGCRGAPRWRSPVPTNWRKLYSSCQNSRQRRVKRVLRLNDFGAVHGLRYEGVNFMLEVLAEGRLKMLLQFFCGIPSDQADG